MHFWTFGKSRPKIAFFFGARPPFKISIYWIIEKVRKILISVIQKWISQNSTKEGGPFGSAGGRIPEGWRRPPPPKSATGQNYFRNLISRPINLFKAAVSPLVKKNIGKKALLKLPLVSAIFLQNLKFTVISIRFFFLSEKQIQINN